MRRDPAYKKERKKEYRLHNCKHGETPKRDMEENVYQRAFNNDYLSKGENDVIFFLFAFFQEVICTL